MSSYAELLVDRFVARGILVDTNLLLLFAVGANDEDIIRLGAFARLSAYTLDDLYLLRNLLSLFREFVTTPHVLAEVSNWVGYLPRQAEIECLQLFRETFKTFHELTVESLKIITHERFEFLGLTDAAIAQVADQYLVLTDDARFVWHLNQMGREALNINHLRQELWLRN